MKVLRTLLLIGICLSASTSAAQPCAPRDEARAQRELSRALRALRDFEVDRAEALLRRAFDRCPRPESAQNLAGLLANSGRPSEAIAILDALLGGAFGEIPPSLRSAAEQVRARGLERLATLDVVLQGADHARIEIDGRRRGDLQEYARRTFRLDPGLHRLRIIARDMLPVRQQVQVEAGSHSTTTVRLPQGEQGLVLVRTFDAESAIRIDGVPQGTGRARSLLAAGVHLVQVDEGESEAERREVRVRGGRIVRVDFLDEPVRRRRRRRWAIALSVVAIAAGTALAVGLSLRAPDRLTHPVLGNNET